jgi:uncharacterized protein YhdP
LEGVRVDLPEQYKKSVHERKALRTEILLSKEKSVYNINYGDLIFAALTVDGHKNLYGDVAISQGIDKVNKNGILISGNLPNLNKSDVDIILNRYQTASYDKNLIGTSSSKSSSTLKNQSDSLVSFDLNSAQFNWDDFTLNHVHLGGGQIQDGWLLEVDSDEVQGKIMLPETQSPIQVNLDYLILPTKTDTSLNAESSSSTSNPKRNDPLSEFDLSEVLDADITANQITLGDEDFGRWSLKLRKNELGVDLKNIKGSVRGVLVSGPDQGANFKWIKNKKEHYSEFRGTVSTEDFGETLERWGQPRSAESESVTLTGDLVWPGSPLMINLYDFKGVVDVKANNGRFYQPTGRAGSAILRLMGLFNFDSWVRRLKLDFSDVYKSGLAFDNIAGQLHFDQGMLELHNPIVVKSSSSTIQMGGEINMKQETLDTQMVVTLPLSGGVTTATALLGGLPAAAGVYLVGKLLDKQINKLTSMSYHIEGPWAQPKLTLDKMFNNEAAQEAGDRVSGKAPSPDKKVSP